MRFIYALATLLLPVTTIAQIDAAFTSSSEYGGQTICLRPYGQYAYISPHCLGETIGSGLYKLQNDTLTLNSYIQEKDIFREVQWRIKGTDSVYISVQLLSQDSSYFELMINDSLKYEMINKNVLAFPKNFVKHFQIRSPFIWYVRNRMIIPEPNNNIIQVFVDDTKGHHRIFHENEKYLYRDNRLTEIPKKSDKSYQPQVFLRDPALKCDDDLFYRYSN